MSPVQPTIETIWTSLEEIKSRFDRLEASMEKRCQSRVDHCELEFNNAWDRLRSGDERSIENKLRIEHLQKAMDDAEKERRSRRETAPKWMSAWAVILSLFMAGVVWVLIHLMAKGGHP